ncbi:MAG: 4-hydroxy-tetrahydrodipicolinate reductase [Clostridia bacterium]|nr:4-hydroxy-tetrahydrodipicolinate reductase [Clostridia bacterium]
MIRVIVTGFGGKMGQAICTAIASRATEFTVAAGVDPYFEGASCNIPVYKSINDVKEEADAVIDFSRPEALHELLPYCREKGLFAIIGTTGLTDDDRAFLDSYALSVPVFNSGNMSLGVNLQLQLVKKAALTFGLGFEPEIVEKHHHLKVDAPSGTALMLADAISSQYPEDVKYMYGRYTRTERRKNAELGIHSVRGGTIVGEHECYFIGTDEVLEINHRAYSKQIFAQGALRAALFMQDKQPGLYSMQDIVMENDVLSNLYATDNQAIIMVKGMSGKAALREVFSKLAEVGIFVDMISVAKYDEVSFTVKSSKLYAACSQIEKLVDIMPDIRVYALDEITKITVEGIGMEFRHGIAAQIFEVMAEAGVEILMVTTSETKVSMAIENKSAQAALKALADNLDL